MFTGKWKTALLLLIIAALSYWALLQLTEEDVVNLNKYAHYPDFTMENFTTLTMNQQGLPKNRLVADFMAHYPDDDATKLNNPELEIYRETGPPIVVRSDKGWITANNEVILLSGNVYLHQNDINGIKQLEVLADDAKVLVDEEYVETDKSVTVIRKRTVTNSVGMRIYMKEQHLEFLYNVRTIIEPKQTP